MGIITSLFHANDEENLITRFSANKQNQFKGQMNQKLDIFSSAILNVKIFIFPSDLIFHAMSLSKKNFLIWIKRVFYDADHKIDILRTVT